MLHHSTADGGWDLVKLARWHALNLASCFTPLTPPLVTMRQELLEALEVLPARQHLIHLALAAIERLELTHCVDLSNEQPSIDDSQPSRTKPRPTRPGSNGFLYPFAITKQSTVLQTASPANTQPELPSHGAGR
ncbi:hypothetical protein PCANC_13632 [Puccinia coronata f. sp. avenae]|uniref:Uncharacterized protein n=1 Tax=Puccinia coronata f. sp. avenae TaxID=200324 RepID=A0A2N5UKC9_9BASI|nr:hypothetical protein PCANC_13632 [Puccinia coronata f. sp. avenae]